MNTIIFLHGGTLNKNMWLPQIDDLKNEFHTLTFDLPRHGENIMKPFTFESAVNSIAKFIESENVRDKFTLVGLSLGGYVAIKYADKYPNQISGLVLSGCSAQYTGMIKLLANIAVLSLSLTNQRIFERKQKKNLLKITSPDIVGSIFKNGLSLLGGKESMNEIIGKDFTNILSHINVPILLVNGENDRLNKRYEHKYQEGNTNVSLKVINDCGHLCSLEKPHLFSQEIRHFMSVTHA